ncbi:hypothetical protein [Filimonas effusa]|uniref:Uncharacterized protein n=1 Tax=Filimonas effusa TaxID=2508721 RepID=A0A4Q1DF56_9BACT|nr:hypothetical protein [Filimonas effusa]RXK87333.1 hypothetical protein ESB13_11305 [Filimonas effusa]
MAESKGNIVTSGLSGLLGRMLVFRTRGDKTIVATRPRKTNIPPTEDQLNVRQLFSDAVTYARAAVLNETIKALYQLKAKPNQSAFNVATADFYVLPEIRLLDVSAYTGEIGSKILIQAIDDVKVSKIKVSIKNGNTVIEEGLATALPNGLDWEYIAKVKNPSLVGSQVTAVVSDLPGHHTNANKEI